MEEYSEAAIFWYFAAAVAWIVAYAAVDYTIIRRKFVEVPVMAVCANITWEFLFGFVFEVNLHGELWGISIESWVMQWAYRIGFFQDCLILTGVFLYGRKQVQTPLVARWFAPLVIASLAIFLPLYYVFREEGYDLPLGTLSAYLDNLMMSVLYILLIMGSPYIKLFSMTAALGKGFGTLFVTIFCFIQYPDNELVQTLGVIVAVLDFFYIGLLFYLKRRPPKSASIPMRA